jgi:SAM-dependent methyltransferase
MTPHTEDCTMATCNFAFDYSKLPYSQGGTQGDIDHINWRVEKLLTRNREIIEGRVVLDLACANGVLSYPCLALGAKRVIGVEGRAKKIEEGRSFLSDEGMRDRMEFVQADVFDFLAAAEPGSFDTIMCCGFLYHTVRQVDFFLQVKRLRPRNVILDTSVSSSYAWFGLKTLRSEGPHPPCLRMFKEDSHLDRDTLTGEGIVYVPTCSFLEKMFDHIGYEHERIHFSPKEMLLQSGLKPYKRGKKAFYIATRGVEPSRN